MKVGWCWNSDRCRLSLRFLSPDSEFGVESPGTGWIESLNRISDFKFKFQSPDLRVPDQASGSSPDSGCWFRFRFQCGMRVCVLSRFRVRNRFHIQISDSDCRSTDFEILNTL